MAETTTIMENVTEAREMNATPSCGDSEKAFGSINPYLLAYAEWYWGVHGYLSLVICAFGITTNALNIIILTRGAMRTPINCILTAIAVCDLLTMCSYIPFVSHFYIECGLEATPVKYSYVWVVYMAFHSNISQTTHAASLWLAVFMAVLRYVYLQTKKCCNVAVTCCLCVFIGLSWCFFMVPNYILTGVEKVTKNNLTMYRLVDPGIGSDNPSRIGVTSFWLIAVLGKLVPCILITVFIGLLLKTLHESAARRKRLFASSDKARSGGEGGTNLSGREGGGGEGGKKRKSASAARHQCTTTMLVVIIVLYMVTEIPQVLVILMSAMSKNFFSNVYMLLADTLDLLALSNNAINFLLYCTMSQQFRQHLLAVKACTGGAGGGGGGGRGWKGGHNNPTSNTFNNKTYHSVQQSGATNNHTQHTSATATTTNNHHNNHHLLTTTNAIDNTSGCSSNGGGDTMTMVDKSTTSYV